MVITITNQQYQLFTHESWLYKHQFFKVCSSVVASPLQFFEAWLIKKDKKTWGSVGAFHILWIPRTPDWQIIPTLAFTATSTNSKLPYTQVSSLQRPSSPDEQCACILMNNTTNAETANNFFTFIRLVTDSWVVLFCFVLFVVTCINTACCSIWTKTKTKFGNQQTTSKFDGKPSGLQAAHQKLK